MTDASDMELLRKYHRQGSDEAFAELARRHVDLVYSAALRHVGIPAHAQEIAQAVFIILARKAGGLRADTVFESWLHETTRLVALSFLRGERRRQFREQEAYMQSTLNDLNAGDAHAWDKLAPLLDEAVSRLGKKDRDAVMLRFFKDKSLREVALALNTNEAAAQRRVLRAVEKLRGWFTKRGVALPVAAMTAAIAANSVQAAPAGLVVTICTAKGAAVAASVTALVNGTIKTIYMTTLQKTLIAASLVVAVGAGIYEAREASTLQTQVQALQQQQAPLTEQNQQLAHERDDATNRLATLANELAKAKANNTELLKLRGEVARLRTDSQRLAQSNATNSIAANQSTLESWLERREQLSVYLGTTNRDARVPEVLWASPRDWFQASISPLVTENDYHRASSRLAMDAADNFAFEAGHNTLERYSESNNGQFPSDISQLKTYCDEKVGRILLEFYEVRPTDSLPGLTTGLSVNPSMVVVRKSPLPYSSVRPVIYIGGHAYWEDKQGK